MGTWKRIGASVLFGAALLASGCASSVVAVRDRAVRDETELLEWRPATRADIPGHWHTHSLEGPAAAVLMDLSYWLDVDGHFSGAALFTGPPPTFEVLSGTWTLAEDGSLQLGEGAAPAQAEVAGGRLRLTGEEGSLVLERAQAR